MNTRCPDEEKLTTAVRTGTVTDEMQGHLKICPHCRELAELTKQMDVFSKVLPTPRLSGASELYRKAKRDCENPFYNILLPIWIVQIVLAVATILSAIAGLFSSRHILSRLVLWLHSLPGIAGLTGLAALVVNTATIASLAIAIFLPLAILGIWFRDILNERPTPGGCSITDFR